MRQISRTAELLSLEAMLQDLDSIPEVLVVLNHPLSK
jgi:hypothetical protein